jgi:hypothetical protein
MALFQARVYAATALQAKDQCIEKNKQRIRRFQNDVNVSNRIFDNGAALVLAARRAWLLRHARPCTAESLRDQLLAAGSSQIENNGTGTCDGPE